MRSIRNFIARLVGSWCERHGIGYQSDFCPQCVRTMVVLEETRERGKGLRQLPERNVLNDARRRGSMT